MASLHHPGVVQVYETGETAEGHLYYVMELVDGEDLASRLRRGRLPMEEAVPLIAQVAEALQAAHQLGIVHRDVKPANIFLSGTGTARLGDFGLALTEEQAEEALRLTRAGTTVGTVEYAAPEQLSRARPVSAASDVFSLGVLTDEVLTGELPRGNFDPPSLCNPEVDAAFDSVVLRALQTDSARRYADAGAFREAFLHAADRRRQQVLRDEAVRRKIMRRTRTVAALAAVPLVTGGSAVLAWHGVRGGRRRSPRNNAWPGCSSFS
jgi:serine/threonine protein kinase